MAEPPVAVNQVDCGNGKRKMIVREREYDLASWHGLKTIASAVIAAVGIVVAMLAAYYTAEASQTAAISAQSQQLATQAQRLNNHDKQLDATLKKFGETLTAQRKVLDENAKAIVRIDTRQEVLINEVKEIRNRLGN
jgi:hypothetical protein